MLEIALSGLFLQFAPFAFSSFAVLRTHDGLVGYGVHILPWKLV